MRCIDDEPTSPLSNRSTQGLNLYALNYNKSELLYAPDTNKDKDKNIKYYCPSCMSVMGLRKGTVKTHHFYHKENSCQFETYLHSVGKRILFINLSSLKSKNVSVFPIINCIEVNVNKREIMNDFYQSDIDSDTNRLEIALSTFFETPDIVKINSFLQSIKDSKDKELINIFIGLHNWLEVQINNVFSGDNFLKLTHFEHNYSSSIGGTIGEYQLLTEELSSKQKNMILSQRENKLQEWKQVKTKNRLSENLEYVNRHINFPYRYDKLEDFYMDNIKIIDYLVEHASLDNQAKLIKLFYIPLFLVEHKKFKQDSQLSPSMMSNIYLDNKKHKGFLADVLVEQYSQEPIFFEIAVTHKCSDEKIASGVEIFEIKLNNMDNLDSLRKMEFNKLEVRHYNG